MACIIQTIIVSVFSRKTSVTRPVLTKCTSALQGYSKMDLEGARSILRNSMSPILTQHVTKKNLRNHEFSFVLAQTAFMTQAECKSKRNKPSQALVMISWMHACRCVLGVSQETWKMLNRHLLEFTLCYVCQIVANFVAGSLADWNTAQWVTTVRVNYLTLTHLSGWLISATWLWSGFGAMDHPLLSCGEI